MNAVGKHSDYKKLGEFSSWDMDRGCRKIVNQKSPGRRRLRIRLKRQERARIKEARIKGDE